ncbi:lytic murein transglycosylase, partial [Companilactobacillus zhachilii]|uniref:lytic murein transglycosylase n=1 Tax=Companilactobacillus zhachilii TaxID=2304606 RepID=UPI0040345920
HDNWKNMHSAYDDFNTGISKWWSGFSKDFGKKWNQSWKDRKTDMHDNWKNMHSAYDDFNTGISKWWSGFSTSFSKGWSSFWKGVQKLFKDIFGTFKDLAHDAMKGVVGAINGGIGGINTVIKFFGGKAQSIAPIKYASGVGYHPGGPALINDQKGPVFEEAFKNPGEPWRVIPKMRNVMVDLKPGATVVPASETAQRFAPSSVPHYANGVGSWIKGELSDMGSWVKDKLEGITDFLKDPLGNLTSVWDKATSKISQATKFGSTFAPAAGHYVVKQSIDWVKKQLSKLKDKELEAQSVAGDPKAAQAWLPIVKKVLKSMGANPPNGIDWEAAAYVREIARESGGNASIRQQISDKNSLAGNPAMGLLQFIPQTFMAYAVPGHTNILSGVDQIMATTNAYMHNGGWNRIGTGRQINFLANGGWLSSPTYLGNGNIAGEVAGEPEVVINPARPSAIPLMNDLMYKMADFHPEFKSSNLMGNISSDIGQKLDAVINLLSNINGKNFAPEINVARTSNNLNQQNQRDTAIYGYQQGNRQ